jgi:hypothetical protein
VRDEAASAAVSARRRDEIERGNAGRLNAIAIARSTDGLAGANILGSPSIDGGV